MRAAVIVGVMAVSLLLSSLWGEDVSCAEFSLSLPPLFILSNLHMNVWGLALLEVLTVCSQWGSLNDTKEQRTATCSMKCVLLRKQWVQLWTAGGGAWERDVCEKVETSSSVTWHYGVNWWNSTCFSYNMHSSKAPWGPLVRTPDRKSTRLNSSHSGE